MNPFRNKFSRINIMGLPFHGLAYDGVFTKPDTSTVPVPNASSVNYLLDMGYIPPDRTDNQHDIENEYEWRSKLLLSGPTALSSDEFVYIDGNNIPWILRITYTKTDGVNTYKLNVSVVKRFGLFEETSIPDLNYEFFDSGLFNYDSEEALYGLSEITTPFYNQNHDGSAVAVIMRALFEGIGSEPRIDWVDRLIVEVNQLAISGIVDPETGSGLSASYTTVANSSECCGSSTTVQEDPTYTSFAHSRHEVRVSNPNPSSQTGMCFYYSSPYSGKSYTQYDTITDRENEVAPGGLREPLQNNSTNSHDLQYTVIHAFFDGPSLKIVKAKNFNSFGKLEGSTRVIDSLVYTYTRDVVDDKSYTHSRDNDCSYFDWSTDYTETLIETLDYKYTDTRKIRIDILVDDVIIDTFELTREKKTEGIIDRDEPVNVSDGGTDENLTDVIMRPSYDNFFPVGPTGLDSIPLTEVSDIVSISISGEQYSGPGEYDAGVPIPDIRSFLYRQDVSATDIGNVLVGWDAVSFLYWSELPLPERFYGLIGPIFKFGIVQRYATYDPYNRLIHDDETRRLCVL